MKNIFILITCLVLTIRCQEKIAYSYETKYDGLSFHRSDNSSYTLEEKWVTKNTSMENDSLSKYYEKYAQYVFAFGGGCWNGNLEELSLDKKNDTLIITYQMPSKPCPEVGEAAATNAYLQIDKIKYPDFLNYKIKWITKQPRE